LTDLGISFLEVFSNVILSSFKGVEFPALPTALKVMFAKMMLPLTPAIFHADILTIPIVLSIFPNAMESGPLETARA